MINVLKASAGTGKTYRLSLEYVASLLLGEDFEQIVVMTFTRKATAEIRERILKHLAEITKDPENSEVVESLREVYPKLDINLAELKAVYKEMLQNKDKIKVYTIDSFINTIFKQAIAPYLNIYTYQIVNDGENEEIIEAVFKQILDNEDYFQQMEKFLTANVERDVDNYISLLKKIINNRWKFLLFDPKSAKERTVGDIVSQFQDCVKMLKEIAKEKGKDFNRNYFRKDFRDYFMKDDEEFRDWLVDNYKLCIKNHFWNGHKTRGKSVKQFKRSMEEEYEKFKAQLAAEIYNQEMLPYQEQIINFSQQVFKIYDRIKFREKKFTHADISNYTYQYLYQSELDLLEGEEVSSYFFELLGTEVNTLLVDEFQDTSVLQWKILKPLINNSDRVIAVGDEKQSIYSWRGGEKELFANLEDILEGSSETLATSYRSEREIIDFVNRFFSGIHKDWDYSAVDYLAENSGGYVEVLVGGSSGSINTDTKKFSNKSEEKQKQIKEFNEQLITDLPAEIAAAIDERIENYSEVGILARKNDDLKRIAHKLDERGIPYVLESQDSLVEHPAVEPIYYLSSYLAYGDYFELIKFLRSEVVGVDGRELKYLLNNKEQIEKYLSGEEITLANQELAEILSFVRDLAELDFEALPKYMIDKLGIVDRYADNSNALKNLYQFFKLMKDFDYLVDFVFYLAENKDSDELKQVGLDNVKAVKLLTIHKAKGLSFETEFFYWDISTGGGYRGNNLEFYLELDKEFEEATDYLLTNSKYNKLLEYLGLDFHKQKQHREFMEEINNVYVALTRPERNLFLYIDVPTKFKFQSGWQVKEWKGKDYELYEEAVLNGIQADYLKELTEKKSLGELQESRKEENLSEVKLEGLAKYFEADQFQEEANGQNSLKLNLAQESKRVEGLVIHYYLEHIKYNRVKERELARDLVRAKYGNIVGPTKLQEIFIQVEDFIEENNHYFSDKWEVFTEYEIDDGSENYRIDRLLVDKKDKKIMILDYKTGASKEKEQLAIYKSIIAKQLSKEYEINTKFLQVTLDLQ